VTMVRARTGPQFVMQRSPALTALDRRVASRDLSLTSEERQPSRVEDRPARGGRGVGAGGDWTLEHAPDVPRPTLITRTFDPEVESSRWDPMIAVGHQFVVISNSHEFGFYDTNGTLLPPRNGGASTMSATAFFAPLIAPTVEGGGVNEHSLNRHLGFQPGFTTGLRCDPTRPAPQSEPCVEEFYDSRAIYDPVTRRFVLLSAVRHSYGFADTVRGTDPMVRRYVAFAVSRTEDPRDGFFMYAITEQNYSDWPRVTVAEGMLVIAHNRHTQERDYEGSRPSVYLFSLAQLSRGDAHPASRKLMRHEVGGNVKPVVPYGSAPGWAMFLRQDDTKLVLYAIRGIANWAATPTLQRDSITAATSLPFMGVAPLVRDSFLYFVGHAEAQARDGSRPARQGIHLLRFRLTGLSSAPRLSMQASDGALDGCFSCGSGNTTVEVPAIGVTSQGTMVIGFTRSSVTMADSVPPEARYMVMSANATDPSPSVRVREGDHMPFHIPKNESTSIITVPSVRMDHSHVTVAPDGRTVWVINMYANRATGTSSSSIDGYKTVVHRFRP
jgi:hypothetical protein